MNVSIPAEHYEPEGTHPTRRIGLAVLGMHRSGTSALTRVLSLLGADLPARLMGAGGSNETGHWEPERLVSINDQLLAEGDGSWDDWRSFDRQLLDEKYLHFRSVIAACLREDFGDSQLFVLKDPRICRLVPLFKDVSDQLNVELRYIIPYRNADEVAASLNARDGITVDYGRLMWARHILEAEADTRGSARVFVPYDALLSDFEGVCHRIGSCLNVDWPIPVSQARAGIADFVRPDLRHHNTSEERLHSVGEIAGFTDQIRANIVKLDQNPSDQEAMGELSLLKEKLDNPRKRFVDATFSELVGRRRRDAESFRLQLEHVQHDVDVKSEQLRQSHAAQEAADVKLEQVQQQLTAAREAAGFKEEEFRRQQLQLQNDLADAAARAQALERSLSATLNSYSWRATRPLRWLASLLVRRRGDALA
ncbi:MULTISPECIES: sulfotransferase family protein [unclassified Ensifer]|uniref:sulfotransferase family protein n=1 Tax=unclassified Ensifer TaxID=2633371 RepID=UPI000812F22B|nr:MULTISPECIES: sulfotransferase family protein [unclassified Ensifer]OCP02790.1 hypothetical protein BC362_02660 [Ensifer sp. LC14]OCP13691.1 hypothetical protein BC374_12700 [Ensifer sp. LC13]OCP29054.1 hypothetical protein BC364_11100 [Ensifer sp. LC499]